MENIKIFTELSQIDCSKHIEKKAGLNYLSWVWAIGTLELYCEEKGLDLEWDNDGIDHDGLVYTHVTINEKCKRMWLPIKDYRNKSIDEPTTMDINTAYARCLAKNIALGWGLGYKVYAGEDLVDIPVDEPKPVLITNANWEQLNKAYTKAQIKEMYAELGITKGKDIPNEYAEKKINEYLANIKNELPAKEFY